MLRCSMGLVKIILITCVCTKEHVLWVSASQGFHLVGSSKNMTGGLLTSSKAIAKRFLWPPERLDVRVLAHSNKPSAVKISLTYKDRHYLEFRITNLIGKLFQKSFRSADIYCHGTGIFHCLYHSASLFLLHKIPIPAVAHYTGTIAILSIQLWPL